MIALGHGAVLPVHPRHDLVTQVREVVPRAGESRNWLPPSEVQQSTHTTMHGGASPPANSASTSSGKLRRNGERFRHMSSWPVRPWMAYTLG